MKGFGKIVAQLMLYASPYNELFHVLFNARAGIIICVFVK